ncbi:MAG TPA: MBL fold metallo-hydrolase [Longimicrobiales bacterium]|nr:MBL fold metallo-hydrolase [Longimicrobiales bacterium]
MSGADALGVDAGAPPPGRVLRVPALPGLRVLRADNASPLTLDGTRTYLVGEREVAVIDPGPAHADHLRTLTAALRGAAAVRVLLTHGHPDHAAGAAPLAARLGATVHGLADGTLAPGETVPTDAGVLVVHAAPGHTPDHAVFHWPERAAVFCGDLLTGGMDTALVAPPEGDLGDYLRSLERVDGLAAGVLLPAHGPPFHDPAATLERYTAHRRERERQVLAALGAGARTVAGVVERVYPGLQEGLRRAAEGAVLAYLEHLAADGRVRRVGAEWEAVAS